MGNRRETQLKEKQIVRLYKEGMMVKDIVKELRLSFAAVSFHLDKYRRNLEMVRVSQSEVSLLVNLVRNYIAEYNNLRVPQEITGLLEILEGHLERRRKE